MSHMSTDLVFDGNVQNTEYFIQAIRKRAFAEGKQRDDQWMADLAATCFVEDAFSWFESLDRKVQGSWDLLRPALLSRYPKPETRRESIPDTRDNIPTPAAAPPLPAASTINASPSPEPDPIGRLKFVSETGVSKGWISRSRFYHGACSVTESSSDALLVSYIYDSRRFEAINSTIAIPKAALGSDATRGWECLALISTVESERRPGYEWGLSSDGTVTPFHVDIHGTKKMVDISMSSSHYQIALGQGYPSPLVPTRLVLEPV